MADDIMRIEFEKRIAATFKALDCLTEYTFARDEHGRYENCSVDMAWSDWATAWKAAVRALGPQHGDTK